jgi:hypothetical protein
MTGLLVWYMSEGFKIALTAVAGILVFVVGQIIQKLFIEPIQEQRKSIGEVLYVLDYYCELTFTEGTDLETTKDASKYLRRATSDLYRNTATIPWYGFFAAIKMVPKRKIIESIQKEVSALTREINNDKLTEAHEKVKSELKIM